ncbi:MAG: DUF4381 family protein [Gammaproteobacteria bacterium]|nr:DUF4381 family protein [Gammaproteobacteria bacterium]
MNNTELESLTVQLADIQLPSEPILWPWYLGGIIALTLLLTVARLSFRQRRANTQTIHQHSSQEALQRLKQLHDEWQAQQIDDQRAAFRLANLLRLGLNLPQLTAEVPPQLMFDAELWQKTIEQLQQLRYHNQPIIKLDHSVFDHARRWLTQEATHP